MDTLYINSWTLLSAFLPIVSVVASILIFKKNATFSSLISLFIAGLLTIIIPSYNLTFEQLLEIVKSALILSLSAILVILPGLYLNGIIKQQKTLDKIAEWIERLPLKLEEKTLILLLGFLPAVESLTGFGVSLFLGVPIFLKLFPQKEALKLSLLGMNIMPWGTLALATTIGANLIQYPVKQLGTITSLTSFFIFPYIAAVALLIIGGFRLLKQKIYLVFCLGLVISLSLFINNYYLYPEIAGILSGLVTGLLGIYLACRGKNFFQIVFQKKLLKIFFPYILVLILILGTRLIHPIKEFLSQLLVLKSNQVSFSIFTSPGIIILLVAILLQNLKPVNVSLVEITKKSKNACLTIAAFLLLSQTMLQSGMIATLSRGLLNFSGEYLSLLLSPLIGMLAGFITGSNVGGNALFIAAQDEIGRQWNQGILFASVHNSGAGHMVFSSIPIIVLVLTIFQDINSGQRSIITENELFKFTSKVSIGIYLTLSLTLLILWRLNVSAALF
ncbi:MAG: L-lactate permease [Crocosphaera sp.]